MQCSKCKGSGLFEDELCPDCNGYGVITAPEAIIEVTETSKDEFEVPKAKVIKKLKAK